MLLDVREAVEDWDRMRTQAREIIAELEAHPPPLPVDEVEEGKALLGWLADEHFTFLGAREYRLEGDGDDVVLRAVPGTGLGILRSDQDMSPSFGKLPPLVRAKAREKTLLVLAKANSQVHGAPPGVPRLRRASRRSTRTARSWASAASSACSPQPRTPSR